MAKDFKPRMKPAMKKPAGKKPRHKHAGKKKAVRPSRGERPTEQPREATPQGLTGDPSPPVAPGPVKSQINVVRDWARDLMLLEKVYHWVLWAWEQISNSDWPS